MHIFFIITSVLFSNTFPDPWNGYSVSNSENLDAFTYNPAGVSINHGIESGYFFAPDNSGNISNNSTIYYATKSNGFGYSLKYNKGDKIFNATDVNISFAGQITKGINFGANWSKESKSIATGFLFRPANFLSLGLVTHFDEDLKEMSIGRFGLGLRPFSSNLLTIGTDITYTSQGINDITSYSPFFDITIWNGISFRSQFDTESFDNFTFDDIDLIASINFDFGKEGFYINKLKPTTSDYGYGLGYFTRTHKKTNIFNKPNKKDRKYIRLDLSGLFIEEKPGKIPFSPFSFFNQERGQQLRKWLDEIKKFKNDESVAGLIIDLKTVRTGFSKKQEMHDALMAFKDSGKKIIVYADYGISNTDYYLISMADEIYINDLTGVNLHGLSMEVTFYKDFLDTINVIPEVFRVNIDGESYKTAGDPFLESTATDQMKENYGQLLNNIYSIFVKGISNGRSWSEEKTKNIINNGPYSITSEIIENDLITSTMYPDQFESYLKEITSCEKDEKCDYNYSIVKWKDVDRSKEYVTDWLPEKKNNIALIYAVGGIMPGESQKGPSGSTVMGHKTINKAIKSAREDKNIDAIILRIDSGGGSAFASDQMWREVDLTTNNEDIENNKPFIASMSDVAASGGYYIACQADKIIANESTVTGSIGVIGLNFNTSSLLNKYGINKEVIAKEGEHADFYTTSRLRNEYETSKIEESINDSYLVFKSRVIAGRDSLNNIDKLDDIAMGRIWSGNDAKSNFLVDEIGGIDDAIALAAKEAGIKDIKNVNIIEYPKRELTENLKKELLNSSFLSNKILFSEIPKEYQFLIDINEMSKEGTLMMLPYAIEIK